MISYSDGLVGIWIEDEIDVVDILTFCVRHKHPNSLKKYINTCLTLWFFVCFKFRSIINSTCNFLGKSTAIVYNLITISHLW